MTTLQDTSRVASKPRHRVRISKVWRTKTNGNFNFGIIVGLVLYMVLSVAYRLLEALVF